MIFSFSTLFHIRNNYRSKACHQSTRLLLMLSVVTLLGCQSTSDTNTEKENSRATLADLANMHIEQKSKSGMNSSEQALLMSKKQRAAKLASLYQNILTLEPNKEVRAKIEYRLVQIGTQRFEMRDFDQSAQKTLSDQALAELIHSYQKLLEKFPNRVENEEIQYQLAKALDLQGNLKQSLIQVESLLTQYPHSTYAAELNFRRGDIYYNLQSYTKALASYQAVLAAQDNQAYYINSVYMSAWALFKMNRLAEADIQFIGLLDHIVGLEKVQPYEDDFNFNALNKRYVSLVADIQRVLSISLSQQQQSKSLVNLVSNDVLNRGSNTALKSVLDKNSQQQSLKYLYLYRHVLFKNLADFLVKNELKYDAELTYQAFIKLAPQSIWAARYSLNLIDLYQQQGKHHAIRNLKVDYVQQYGLQSEFWQQGLVATPAQVINKDVLMTEILPNLLQFSYQQSRYLYAQAQAQVQTQTQTQSQTQSQGRKSLSSNNENKLANAENAKKHAYASAAHWLSVYLSLAKQPQAKALVSQLANSEGLLADEFLYAEASFEAQEYQQALNSYEYIAYHSPIENNAQVVENNKRLRKEAAYAATLTVREMLLINDKKQTNVTKIAKASQTTNAMVQSTTQLSQALIITRNRLDKAYIEHYSNDKKALSLAVLQAQYAFENEDHLQLTFFSDFILNHYDALSKNWHELAEKSLKQVQIATQLQANDFYRQAQSLSKKSMAETIYSDKNGISLYAQAEKSYQLALRFIGNNSALKNKMRELLAACIYFQGQQLKTSQPLIAINHLLRVGEQIPESRYRLNAQFEAANLLLEHKYWQRAITELLSFQQRYPTHEFTRSIPAKLAQSYEQLKQWEMAAEQYLVIVNNAAKMKADNAKNDNRNNDVSEQNQRNLTELMREAQYSAAELYVKAGDITHAISTFRTYAHNYPEPFDVAQEVRYKMSDFYKTTQEPNKQYFWYRKIIKHHELALAKHQSHARSTYLASVAALGLGEAHQQTFKYTKLTLPLKNSLRRKQKAMKLAIGYYQKLLSYQLAEFVPHGTFNLAQMYRQLAADVMSSQRPKKLDELALEEYDLLLEEIADPFEQKAIEIHESNAQRAWQNVYNMWVDKSFTALAQLSPALYDRSWHDQIKWPDHHVQTLKGGAIDAVRTLH